jgi:Tfp pilus assembly protein PilX
MAMIITVLALMVLLVLGIGLLQSSVASLRVAGNDRTTKAALAIAEAGAEYARETLRTQLKAGQTLSQELATAAHGSALVDATHLSAFDGTTALVNKTYPLNTPLIGPTAFASGNFQVFLTNDRREPGAASQAASVQLSTDTNSRIMITSFGNGPGGSVAAIQEQLKLYDAFLPGQSLPGAIILPGPTVNFQSFTSNARQVTGKDSSDNCYPTVATTTNAANTLVQNAINTPPSKPNYQSCLPYTGLATENFLPTASNPYDPVSPNTPLLAGDPRLVRVNYLNDLVANVKAVADSVTTSEAGVTLGSTANPKVVFIGGDATFSGNLSGAGILLVTGTLTFTGTPSYNGAILVIGEGNYVYKGYGASTIAGAILVANTNNPWIGNSCTAGDPCVGIPSYTDIGGGNSTKMYDGPSLADYAAPIMPLQILSFAQLR